MTVKEDDSTVAQRESERKSPVCLHCATKAKSFGMKPAWSNDEGEADVLPFFYLVLPLLLIPLM